MPNTPLQPEYLELDEIQSFREKTDQLMSNLDNNDIESAMKCIDEIKKINEQSVHTIIGKITRDLHCAINDLQGPSNNQESGKNTARSDLDYVIEITDKASRKTLDMTEKCQADISDQHQYLDSAIAELNKLDEGSSNTRNNCIEFCQQGKQNLDTLGGNISEIIIAQNFQDLTSQSITKAIKVIKDVESSLIGLTQYTSILNSLSNFNADDTDNREELKTNIEKIENISEHEHLDQGEVDNLLSDLGF